MSLLFVVEGLSVSTVLGIVSGGVGGEFCEGGGGGGGGRREGGREGGERRVERRRTETESFKHRGVHIQSMS